MYTKELMEHFMNPKNVGVIEDADGVGEVGNIACGDVMWIYIKIGENKKGEKVIKDIKFKTFGCVAAIATSSKITELAKGKTIEEALKITKDEVAKSLGGLPPVKMHCSLLATDALKEAIYDYLTKNNLPVPEELKKEHERIKKEKEFVEERFKEFVEEQKKMVKQEKEN